MKYIVSSRYDITTTIRLVICCDFSLRQKEFSHWSKAKKFPESLKKKKSIIDGYASGFNDVNELPEIIFLTLPLAS